MPPPDPAAGPDPRPRSPGPRTLVGALLVVVAVLVTVGATASLSNDGNGTAAASSADHAYAGPGPYAAGTSRITLADGDGAQLWYPVDPSVAAGQPTEVARMSGWLPAAEAAQPALAPLSIPEFTDAAIGTPVAAPGSVAGSDHRPFPVVVFADSSGSTPEESSTLTDHLATWGFVVIAPDLRADDLAATLTPPVPAPAAATAEGEQTGELDRAIAFLRASDPDPTSPLYRRLDLTEVGVVGFGSGGGAALALAALDPTVRTYVALAPTPVSTPATIPPGLVMYGTSDQVVSPASVQQLWAGLPSPRRLVVVAGAGYDLFDDDCAIVSGGRTVGAQLAAGPAGPARQLGAQDDDGCRPPDVAPATAQPLVLQAVTAQLRNGLGIDVDPVGLDTGLDHAFPGVTASYYQRG